MLKNKKGFTLIEVLAAVTILGIVTTIGVVSVNKIMDKSRKQHYITAEETLKQAGQSYATTNRSALPKAIGQRTKITLGQLITAKYIQEITDHKGNKCSDNSYVQIFKYSQKEYSYSAYLDCGTTHPLKEAEKKNKPRITAHIEEEELADGKKQYTTAAEIKIYSNGGNDDDEPDDTVTLVSYKYIIYKDGVEVLNTGDINAKGEKELELNIPISKYSPGNVEIYVSAVNIYGNVAAVTAKKNIKDKKPPKCVIADADKASATKEWTKGNRTITIGCDDGKDGSGCSRADNTYTQTFDKTTRIGVIKIKDKEDNETECKVSVYVDKTKPKDLKWELRYNSSTGTKITDSTKWTNKKVWLGNFSAIDDDAGIKKYEFSTNCTKNVDGEFPPEQYYEFNNTTQEKYCIRAYDKANNVSDWSDPILINVDKIAPTCEYPTNNYTTWTNQSRTITYGCNDTGGSGCDPSHSGSSKPFSSTQEKFTVPSYTIKDKAGNQTTCDAKPTVNVLVDTTAPDCGTASVDSSSGTISFPCIENSGESGCTQTSFSGNTSSSSIEIRDNANNTNTCSIWSINIKKHNQDVSKKSEYASAKASISYIGLNVTINATMNQTNLCPMHNQYQFILKAPDGTIVETSDVKGSCGGSGSTTITYTATQKGTYTLSSVSKNVEICFLFCATHTVDAFNINNIAQFEVK